MLAHFVLPRPPVYELTFSHDPRLIQNLPLMQNWTYRWTDVDDMDSSNITKYHNGHLVLVGDSYIDLEAQSGYSSVGARPLPRIGGANTGANGTLPLGWSIEILFKPNTHEWWAKAFDIGGGVGLDNLILGYDNNSTLMRFEVYNSMSGNQSIMPVIDNTTLHHWYHVVIVITPHVFPGSRVSHVATYVDGVLGHTAQWFNSPRDINRTHAYIGKSNWANEYFDCYLDTFRLYDYSLSAAEVHSLYTVTHEELPAASVPVQSFEYHTAPVASYTFSKRPTGLMVEGTNYRWDGTLSRYPHEGVALFNGQGEYINLASYPSNSAGAVLGMIGSSFSIEVWVKWDALRLFSRIVDLGGVAGYGSHNIILGVQGLTSNLMFEVYSGDRWSQVLALDVVQVGVWQHVVASVEQVSVNDSSSASSGRLRLYVDGVERGSALGYAPQLVERPNAFIGRSNWPSDAYFAGAIDALYVYDVALSLEQVAAHHLTPRPPVFELAFARDPRPWVSGVADRSAFSYDWQAFDPADWLTNGTQTQGQGQVQTHAGHLTMQGEQWVNLTATQGPHSLGTALSADTLLGGVGSGDSMADGRFRGWSLEVVVRVERQEVGAKLFDVGAGPFQDNLGMGFWDARSRLNLYSYGGPSGTTGLPLTVIDAVQLHHWYHVLVVMRPSGTSGRADVQLYVDGEALPASNDYLPYPRPVVRRHATLAKSPWVGDEVMDMALDTFRIYDFALTADTARSLYLLQLTDSSALQVAPLWHAQPLLSYTFDAPPSAGSFSEGTAFTWQLGTFPHTGLASFDGVTHYINLMTYPDDAGTPFPSVFGGASFSVEAWVRYASFRQWSRLLDLGNGLAGDNILIANVERTQRLTMHVYLQSNDSGSDSTQQQQLLMGGVDTNGTPLRADTWHHIVCTLDDLTAYPANRGLDPLGPHAAWLRIYVDAALWGESAAPRPRAVQRTLAYLGKSHWGADELFAGDVDALYLYDVALSPEQVAVHRLVPSPPLFDLSFDSDPRWWLGGDSARYTYGWQEFDPQDALSNSTRYHSGHLVLSGESRESSYVNLSALTGYSSVGLSVPRLGGTQTQTSAQAGGAAGLTFELSVKLSTVGKWAKLLDWGSEAAPGWYLDNIQVGYLDESSTLEFRVWNSLKGPDASTYVEVLRDVRLNQWYHLVIVVSPTPGSDPLDYSARYDAYVDGVRTHTQLSAYYPQQVRRPSALLGRTNWLYSDDAPFACKLDALRVYDYAMPQYVVTQLYRLASDPSATPISHLPSSSAAAAAAVRHSSSSTAAGAAAQTMSSAPRTPTAGPTSTRGGAAAAPSSSSAKKCPRWAAGSMNNLYEPNCRCPEGGRYPSQCYCPEPQEGYYPYCDDPDDYPTLSSSTGVSSIAPAGPSSSLIAAIVVALLLIAAVALAVYFKYFRGEAAMGAGSKAQGTMGGTGMGGTGMGGTGMGGMGGRGGGGEGGGGTGGEDKTSSLLGSMGSSGSTGSSAHSGDYHAHDGDDTHHTHAPAHTNGNGNGHGQGMSGSTSVEML